MFNTSKEILIVSPKRDVRTTIETYFNNLEYWNITGVETLFVAKKKMQRTQYGLVISDDILPGTTGLELLRQVNKESITYDYMAIMGNPSREEIVEVADYSAWWLEKPITQSSFEDLIAKIQAAESK